MNENESKNKNSLLPILKTTAAVGLTGIGFFVTGVYIPETIVGTAIAGVGGGMMSRNFEKGMESAYNRMSQTTANNHDLQKAFGRALVKACTTLEKEYQQEPEYKQLRKRDQTSIQIFFKTLRQAAEKEIANIHPESDWFKDQDLQKYLTASANLDAAEADLQSKLKAYRHLENGFQAHFVDFVKDRFSKAIQFHYIEILKDNQKENTKVWRAYQLQVQENLQKTLTELQQNQVEQSQKWQQLTERLAAMTQAEPQKEDYSQIVSAELLLGLGRHFKVLKTQLTELQKEVDNIAVKQAEHIEISKETDVKAEMAVEGIEEANARLGAIEEKIGVSTIPQRLTANVFRSEIFLGRTEDLQAIEKRLWKSQNPNVLLLVNGRGGMGKTTLASEYYHRNAHRYRHLAWVFAERSIAEALLTLAASLKLQFAPTDTTEQRLTRLLQALQNLETPCLLVIDNANKLDDLQKHYKALRTCSNFHLLLTTRITTFRQAATYAINALPEAQAIELFQTHYPKHRPQENDLLKGILKAVGSNTLVIELLAKNLARLNKIRTRYQLQDLLHDLQNKGLLQLSQSKEVAADYYFEAATPETIIAAMYDLGELSEAEKALLAVFAVLPAENIEWEVLESLLVSQQGEEMQQINAMMELLGEEVVKGLLQKEGIGENEWETFKNALQSNSPNSQLEALETNLAALAQKGWLDMEQHPKTADADDLISFRISPVIQEVCRDKHGNLLEDCELLISNLINKLDYEGTHITGSSYQEAALYARYAENITESIEQINHQLSGLCERIGNFYQVTGNLPKTFDFYLQYVARAKKLYEDAPNNPNHKNNLAISYEKLGSTHSSLGNLEQALKFFEEDAQLTKELYEAYPSNVGFKNGLAISYSKLGSTHSSLGNLEQALKFFEERSRLGKELYEAYPSNVGFKNGLAISYEKLGSTHSSLGNLEQALKFFEEDAQLTKELYEAYPSNVGFKNGLAISYSKLGSTHSSLGNLEQALKFFEERSRLGKELYEAYPSNVGFKNGLAISYEKLGSTHSSLGNLEQALKFFEEDAQLTKELYEAYPFNVGFKNGLAISYEKLGSTHSSLGNLEQALKFFEEDAQLTKELYEAYPSNVGFKNGLAISYEKLGSTHSSLGNLEQALKFFEEDAQLTKELYEAYPSNVGFKNGLAISYEKLGSTHSSLGNLEQALKFFEERSRLGKELYEAYPSNVGFKNGLAISYVKLGTLSEQMDKKAEGRLFLEQAREIWEELVVEASAYIEFQRNLKWVRGRLEG